MPQTILVTGSSGFLGKHLVSDLLDDGYSVVAFDLRQAGWESRQVELGNGRLVLKQGDITSQADCEDAVVGVDAVIHSASPSHHAPANILRRVNITGTMMLLDAARAESSCRAFVYTSSSSVIFSGADTLNADESWKVLTAKDRHGVLDAYSASKAEAEVAVLAADSPALRTTAIRPAALFGPEDTVMFPRLIAQCKSGRFKYMIGDGTNLFDWTYVKNVTQSLMLALAKITSSSKADVSAVAGEAFHITNDEPQPFWAQPIALATGLGYPAPTRKLPVWLIANIMSLLAAIFTLINPLYTALTGKPPLAPPLASHEVRYMGINRTYNIAKAKRVLGYQPRFTMRQGWDATIEWAIGQGHHAKDQ
jgi:sterol-4alpha-carboxylate 3-dehydrogenase (decarboxylating)